MSPARPLSPLVLLLSLVSSAACGGAAAEGSTAPAHAEASASPCEAHGDRLPHPGVTPEAYQRGIENERRHEWQQPERVVAALGLSPGDRVVDLGTGSGFWLAHLHAAVAPDGVVLAEDIDDGLLDLVRRRVTDEGLSTVEARLGQPDDPLLEEGHYDLALLVNTYHHLCDPAAFLAAVARGLAPDGRLVVIDFREGRVSGPAHRVDREPLVRELEAAGYRLLEEHDFLEYQHFLVLARPAAD